MPSDASTRGSRTQNETRIVKNLTTRSITLGDFKHPVELRPGKSVDLLKHVSLDNIGRSKDLKLAVQLGWLQYKDRDSRTVAKSKIQRAIIPAVLRDITPSSSTSAGIEEITELRDVLTITSDTTLVVDNDLVILVNALSGSVVVTLPSAETADEYMVRVKKIDSSVNTVTLATIDGETIDLELTKVISVQHTCIPVVSDGSNWWVM